MSHVPDEEVPIKGPRCLEGDQGRATPGILAQTGISSPSECRIPLSEKSRERVKSALLDSGFGYPNESVTIKLAPANVRKEGAGFDLPMALGILGTMGTTGAVGASDDYLSVGELSLDGSIRALRGALSIAVAAQRRGSSGGVRPGLLSTAGQFLSDPNSNFIALDPATGAPLWHVTLQQSVTNAPMTYELDGVQYLAAAAGDTLYGFAMRR